MNRDLGLYILARKFAWTASSLLLLSFGIRVKTLTGSNSLAGLTTAFVLAPRVIGVFAGSILDRLPRRGTLAGASFASGLLLLPLLAVRSAADLWMIWATCIAYGVLGVLISASAAGALKRVASPDQVARAISIINGSFGVIQVFGPIVGAGLFALIGPHAVVLVCIGLFALAGLMILCVRLPGSTSGHVDGVLAGLSFVLRRPGLSQAVGSLVVIQVSLGFVDASLYALVEAMGRTPQFSGIVVGVQGAGAILGGFGAAVAVRRLGEIRSMVLGLLSTVICLVLMVVFVHQTPVVLVLAGIAGAVMTLAMTSFSILFQRLTPENVIGRAQAAVAALQSVPAVAAVAVGSLLVGLVDFRLLYLATALTVLLSAVLLFTSTRRSNLSGESS